MRDDVVYWLQERALRRYGATMNAAHTETQEWLWADEITRLREENARLRDLLAECDAVLSWVFLEGMDEAIPSTCPAEYARVVDAAKAIAAVIREGGQDE